MRVERLQISGLRSHRGDPASEVVFKERGLVAIVGPTGAGKSSILEAVCFALFGEATYGGKSYKELSTDGNTEISVSMEFSIGLDRYHLRRVVAPNRQGSFVAKETWIQRIGDDEKVLAHVDQVRRVDESVRKLLGGMDREQFCQAVLLAQNRFARLLEADERSRNELLDILLGLTSLEQARKGIQATHKLAQRNVERLEDRRRTLPADPVSHAAERKAKAAALEALAAGAATCVEELGGLSKRATEFSDKASTLENRVSLRVAGSDGRQLLEQTIERLEALADDDVRMDGEISQALEKVEAAQSTLRQANTALEGCESEFGKLDEHGVWDSQLKMIRQLHEGRPAQVTASSACDSELADATASLGAKTAGVEKLQTEAETAAQMEGEARLAEGRMQEAVDQHTNLLAEAKGIVGRLERSGGQDANTPAQLAEACGSADTARAELASARAAEELASLVLTEAQRAHAAAAAAEGCVPGDACPVCTQDLPASWDPPRESDLSAALEEQTRARQETMERENSFKEAEQAWYRVLSALQGTVTSVLREHSTLVDLCSARGLPSPPAMGELALSDESTLESAQGASVRIRELSEALAPWLAKVDENESPLRNAADAAVREASAATKLRTEADRNVVRAQTEVNTLRHQHGVLEERLEGFNRAIETIDAQLSKLCVELPPRLREMVSSGDVTSVERAQEILSKDTQKVAGAANAQSAASADMRHAQERHAGLLSEKERLVLAPRARLAVQLSTIDQAISDLSTSVQQSAPALVDESDNPTLLLGAARKLRSRTEAATAAAKEIIQRLRDKEAGLVGPARAIVRGLADLKGAADPEGIQFGTGPDSEEPLTPETLSRVQQLVGAAQTASSVAASEAQTAEAIVVTAGEIEDRIEALTSWRADLNGAADALKKDHFPSWVREQLIEELVQSASELLSQMTGGRYRFNQRLLISDEIAGIVRSANTLSGGEKFEAALALALGVAEIAGRSGIRFDTLFLDEGFAGLDQANLSRAIDALEAQVDAGRSIVLITHIGTVADRIRDVLLVEPDGTGGSSTRWLNDDERYELGADLDLVEAVGSSV
jgi:exonuclease SbcC